MKNIKVNKKVTIDQKELENLKNSQRKAFLYGVLLGLVIFVIPAIF